MTADNSRISGVTELRLNRYDMYGNAIFQITEEYATMLNNKAKELKCTHLPAKEYNNKWTIKQKNSTSGLPPTIVSGVVSVKHWKYNGKSGISTTIKDFITDPNLNRYEDSENFGWQNEEL